MLDHAHDESVFKQIPYLVWKLWPIHATTKEIQTCLNGKFLYGIQPGMMVQCQSVNRGIALNKSMMVQFMAQ